MPQRAAVVTTVGGLNLTALPIASPAGQMAACENYEPDVSGYTRFSGYERLDGRPKPSLASDATEREARRAAITAVPGKGGVLATWRVRDPGGLSEYAVRENTGDSNATVYRSSGSGWVAMPLASIVDFAAGNGAEISTGDTFAGLISGATGTVARIVHQSGTYAGGDAVGYFDMSATTGTFLPGEAIEKTGTGWTAVFGSVSQVTVPNAGQSSVKMHNFFASNSGDTSYFTLGGAAAFEVNGTDVFPLQISGSSIGVNHLAVFSEHLFLGMADGSLIHSAPNDPRDFKVLSGSGQIFFGRDVVGFEDAAFGSLVVYGADIVSYLTGTSSQDFIIQPILNDAAPLPSTMQMAGGPIFMDEIGVRRLATTEAFGSWRMSTLTSQIEPLIRAYSGVGISPIGSMRVRARDLYRVFMSDGSVISLYFGRRNVEMGRLNLPIVMSCQWIANGQDSDQTMLIGASDGFVYEMDVGNSFDGAVIDAYITFAPYAANSLQVKKRFVSVGIEVTGPVEPSMGVSAEYDYGDTAALISHAMLSKTDAGLGGSFWDLATWDEAYWAGGTVYGPWAQLNGQGKNIVFSLSSKSNFDEPHTITALIFNVIDRALQRRAT